MPFRSAVVKVGADHLLFVIHPRETDWALTGIRLQDDGFEQCADLPTAWAGLTDAALEAASGGRCCETLILVGGIHEANPVGYEST